MLDLSSKPAWTAAAKRSTVKPVDLVKIFTVDPDTGSPVEGTSQFSLCSDPHASLGYPASVENVGYVPPKLDPIDRSVAYGDYRMRTRRDAFVRNLVSTVSLANKYAELYIGWRGIDENDYVKRVRGVVYGQPVADETGVEWTIKDAGALLREQKVKPTFANKHPLECIQIILDEVGVPSGLYDASSLDPTTLPEKYQVLNFTRQRNGTEGAQISHGIFELVDAWDLINEILLLLNGTFLPDENGIYTFKQYDASASVVATLERRDIASSEPGEVVTINNWSVEAETTLRNPKIETLPIGRQETNSITQHTIPGGDTETGRLRRSFGVSKWINGQGTAFPLVNGADKFNEVAGNGDVLSVHGAGLAGFSGCRFSSVADGASRPSYNAPNTTTKLVYLLLIGQAKTDGVIDQTSEVISCNAVSLQAVGRGSELDDDGNWFYGQANFTIESRDAFGWHAGSPPDWIAGTGPTNKLHVYDITPAWHCVTDKLERTALLSGMVRGKLTLHSYEHYTLQLGDLIGIEDDVFLFYGKDGLNGLLKWEIVSKVAEWPNIELEVALTEGSPSYTIETPVINPVLVPIFPNPEDNAIYTHPDGDLGSAEKVVTHEDGIFGALGTIMHL